MQRQQKHHKAVPYKEVPAVVADIRKLDSTSAKALLFTIPDGSSHRRDSWRDMG